jgi:phosphate transport system substrate-binding protein
MRTEFFQGAQLMKTQLNILSTGIAGLALVASVATANVGTANAQTIKIDGSSTVGPISEAVAETYNQKNPRVRTTVGISGTGGGFKKFVVGEIDIAGASRPIKSAEAAAARKNNIQYIELPVAYDAITVVVNQRNTWAKSLTKAELKKIWEPGSKVNNWSQVRAGFPNRPLRLFGPGTASGTFEYFTEAINGTAKASRSDYNASEDDNALVQGVANDAGALGYFGLAYYEENKNKLNAVSIDNGNGPVAASSVNVLNGRYQPLARPIFIYVNKAATAKPHIAGFVRFYIQNSTKISNKVGYIGLPASITRLAMQRFNKKQTGSLFAGKGATVGVRLSDLLRKEASGR